MTSNPSTVGEPSKACATASPEAPAPAVVETERVGGRVGASSPPAAAAVAALPPSHCGGRRRRWTAAPPAPARLRARRPARQRAWRRAPHRPRRQQRHYLHFVPALLAQRPPPQSAWQPPTWPPRPALCRPRSWPAARHGVSSVEARWSYRLVSNRRLKTQSLVSTRSVRGGFLPNWMAHAFLPRHAVCVGMGTARVWGAPTRTSVQHIRTLQVRARQPRISDRPLGYLTRQGRR